MNNNGEVRYEDISFIEAEKIFLTMEMEAQTTTTVDKFSNQYLGLLLEGTNPIKHHQVIIVDDVDVNV